MPQGSRPSRVADQLRAEITDLLAREVHDPGIGFLTITHVKVTPDLQVGRVYYTTLGDPKARRETQRALQRAAPFLRRHIGRRLRLKRVPELEFFYDEAIERGDRIEQILQEITAGRSAGDSPSGASSTSRPGVGEPSRTHAGDEASAAATHDDADDDSHRD
jgi:ribosome-binding factor A